MLVLLILAITATIIAISTRRQLVAERNARGFWRAEKAECLRILEKIKTEAHAAPRKAQAERIVNRLLAEGHVKVPADLNSAYKCAETTIAEESDDKPAEKPEATKGEVITLSKGKRA